MPFSIHDARILPPCLTDRIRACVSKAAQILSLGRRQTLEQLTAGSVTPGRTWKLWGTSRLSRMKPHSWPGIPVGGPGGLPPQQGVFCLSVVGATRPGKPHVVSKLGNARAATLPRRILRCQGQLWVAARTRFSTCGARWHTSSVDNATVRSMYRYVPWDPDRTRIRSLSLTSPDCELNTRMDSLDQ